jgi:hypothetical protein
MMHLIAALAAAVVLTTDPATVAGTWNMGLQGDHVIPVALVLQQDGRNVKGTIALPTQRNGDRVEVSLAGEFVGNALTLSGTLEHGPQPTKITIAGKLTDEGAIEGMFGGPHGDMPFTAERLKVRK